MSTYTDENIPIKCSECENWTEEGLRSMMIHILKAHPDYEPGIAYKYALLWMEDAYKEDEENDRAYYEDRSYERKLDRLRGKP